MYDLIANKTLSWGRLFSEHPSSISQRVEGLVACRVAGPTTRETKNAYNACTRYNNGGASRFDDVYTPSAKRSYLGYGMDSWFRVLTFPRRISRESQGWVGSCIWVNFPLGIVQQVRLTLFSFTCAALTFRVAMTWVPGECVCASILCDGGGLGLRWTFVVGTLFVGLGLG